MSDFTAGALIGLIIGCIAGFAVGATTAKELSRDLFKNDLVVETEQECNIDKPAGTICKWEATWKPVSVDKGE